MPPCRSRSGRGNLIDAAELLHLSQQSIALAGSQNLRIAPRNYELGGMVTEQTFRRGIAIDHLAFHVHRNHCRAGRVEQFSQSLPDGLPAAALRAQDEATSCSA